jgi:hypothetical protein
MGFNINIEAPNMGYQIHIFSRIGNFDSGIPPIPFILRQITDPLPCPPILSSRLPFLVIPAQAGIQRLGTRIAMSISLARRH